MFFIKPEDREARKLILIMAGLILFLYIAIVAGTTNLLKSMATRIWIMVPCTIISAGATYNETENSDGDVFGNGSFYISYKYKYNNKEYTSDCYNATTSPTSNMDLRPVASYYQSHKNTFCYVNPFNPKEAVLERSTLFSMIWIVISPLFYTIIFIVFMKFDKRTDVG